MNVHVLVVDDNRAMRALVRTLLRAADGFRSWEAGDVPDALEIMKSTPIDLVIADLAMQPIDGIEFTRMVRTARDSPNIYAGIIMMTGHSERAKVNAARNAGVNSFLVKPISAKSLIAHINAVSADSRPFVRTKSYFGPDRRVGPDPKFAGPMRRSADRGGEVYEL